MDRNKKREYCEILGVNEEADEDTIKKAYRRLVLEWHPDRPGNKGREQEASQNFNKINEAYEQLVSTNNTLNVLKGIFKSQDIHTSLEHFFFTSGKSFVFNNSFQQSSRDFATNQNSGPFGQTTTSSIFTQVPPQQPPPPKRTPKNGQSLQTTLKIGFFESINGCIKTIEYNRSKSCTHCEGHGSFTSRIECKDCSGKGTIQRSESTGNMLIIPCTSCYSVGYLQNTTENCTCCNGSGKTVSKKTSTITVPAGVFSGMKKVYEGEGDEGEDGGSTGDLIIYFEVDQHPFFQRPNHSSDDVFCRVALPFPQAVLGTVLEVPSMHSKKLSITIQPGTQHEQIIRVAGEGFYSISKQRKGDMFIQVSIEIPKTLDDQEKDLLRQISKLQHFQPMFSCRDEERTTQPPKESQNQ